MTWTSSKKWKDRLTNNKKKLINFKFIYLITLSGIFQTVFAYIYIKINFFKVVLLPIVS